MYLIFLKKYLNLLKFFFIENFFSLLYILFIFSFIFYTTIFIPQKIKINKHIEFIESLKIGDEIVTIGGLIGKIYKFINNDYLLLIINNNQKILINKNYIKSTLPKGTFNIS